MWRLLVTLLDRWIEVSFIFCPYKLLLNKLDIVDKVLENFESEGKPSIGLKDLWIEEKEERAP